MQSPVFSPSIPNFRPTPLIKLHTTWVTINSRKLPAIAVKKKNRFNCCCSENSSSKKTVRTCKNCKTQFEPSLNNPLACRFHTSHFAGETKRKFESVHTGGTMSTPNSGEVLEYWHCCGSEDPFDPGCTSSPHLSYDD